MDEPDNISAEIDAIIQNTDKKKMSFEVKRMVEIEIDKNRSSVDDIFGEFRLVTEKKYLDGSSEHAVKSKYQFHYENGKEFLIEQYDINNGVHRNILKSVTDFVKGVLSVASTGVMSYSIDKKEALQCTQKRILVICETGKNQAVRDKVDEMIFNGEVNSHVDTGCWSGVADDTEKSLRWSILELERRVKNRESVVVTGTFNNWYELIPIAVISSMSGTELSIGRTAGQKLCIGNILDINKALEYFTANSGILQQFYCDPYSSIEHFKNVDNTINSLIIFPSIFHNFLTR